MSNDVILKSDDITISVKGVGKLYQLFDDPRDRLKHMLLWRFGKMYGHPFWALRNVSFDLHRGEMLAIIGKNGSGKSTLLQMIAGTLTPTEGSIYCSGRIGALLELGSGFNPEYSGRENIQLNASILGISSNELKEKIQSIIDFADIGEFIDQPVKIYSSGMFVRLAFAVTTGLESDVLLIDEALAVGDVFFRQKCYQRLDELRKKGVSIILVTHSMSDVEQFCTRGILLNHGEQIFQGQPVEAVKRYYLVTQENTPKINTVQESTTSVQSEKTQEKHENSDLVWPQEDAFIDISKVVQITNEWAQCTKVAVCNQIGEPCHVFQQGEIASFFYEFELLHDIEIPVGGIRINNDKNIIVHAKSTLEYGSDIPVNITKGSLLRFYHNVKLEIGTGEYTYQVALSTMNPFDYSKRDCLSVEELYTSKITYCCIVPSVGQFRVIYRTEAKPVILTHHGLVNLPGKCSVNVLHV